MTFIPAPLIEKLTSCGFNEAQIKLCGRYEELIRQWQKAINLISPTTLPNLMERHILDSAQMWPIVQKLSPDTKPLIIDLGSGGGLPGIVLAIAGADVTMVESDTRKCIFLRETARELGLTNVTVITERIEKTSGISAPIITARALASLDQLIQWSTPLMQENGHMVFMKGADVTSEIKVLDKNIQDKITLIDSITDRAAKIVVI